MRLTYPMQARWLLCLALSSAALSTGCSALFSTEQLPGDEDAGELDPVDASVGAADAFVAGSCRDRESFENQQFPAGWLVNAGAGASCGFEVGSSACGDVNVTCDILADTQTETASLQIPIEPGRGVETLFYVQVDGTYPSSFQAFLQFKSQETLIGEAFLNAQGAPGVYLPDGNANNQSMVPLPVGEWIDLRVQVIVAVDRVAMRILSGDAVYAQAFSSAGFGIQTRVDNVEIGIPIAGPVGDPAHIHIDGVLVRDLDVSSF